MTWQWAQTDTSFASGGLLGPAAYVFVGGYLCLLVLLGWLGHRAKREDSLTDFYLGGRGLGLMVLLLTLYATQYSGNTMLGFVGKAYRQGYQFLAAVTFMMAIIGFYLIYAPRLQRLAHARKYVTMGDFLQDRFRYRPLTIFATTLGVLALGNYILTNLKALGLLAVTITGNPGSYAPGIILLAVIMLVYELLGGLRSVAWTDVIQGILLLFGISIIFVVANVTFGHLGEAAHVISLSKPELLAVPTWKEKVDWLCTLLLVGVGIAMYPHAIQRIYAAKDARTLQRSLQVMVFLPLFTTLLMLILGLLGLAQFPDLPDSESDGVTLRWLALIVEEVPSMRWIVLLCISAILAATMSTVDSALLAISSLVAKDIYPAFVSGATPAQMHRMGKLASLVIMAGAVGFAIFLQGSQIWDLIKLKLELLCQVAPAFLLGIHWKGLRARPVFAGMIVGTVIAVAFRNADWLLFQWLPPGIVGLIINLSIGLLGSLRPRGQGATTKETR